MVRYSTIMNLIEKNSGVAYVSYVDENGFPVTKTLTPRKIKSLGTIYFSTNTSSNKVAAYLKHNKGSVYFVDKRFYRGVSLMGTVEIIDDLKIKQELWREGDEKFYPLGVQDGDYCILKFTLTHGRYFAAGNKDFRVVDLLSQNE